MKKLLIIFLLAISVIANSQPQHLLNRMTTAQVKAVINYNFNLLADSTNPELYGVPDVYNTQNLVSYLNTQFDKYEYYFDTSLHTFNFLTIGLIFRGYYNDNVDDIYDLMQAQPEAIAYYDMQNQFGISDATTFSSRTEGITSSNPFDLYFCGMPGIIDGKHHTQYMTTPSALNVNSDIRTVSSGATHNGRTYSPGVANTLLGVFDLSKADRDTTNLLTNHNIIKIKAAKAGDTLSWRSDTIVYHAAQANSTIWIDTAQFPMVHNAYYVFDIEWANAIWITNAAYGGRWNINRSDADANNTYSLFERLGTNHDYRHTRFIYQHKRGTYLWASISPSSTEDPTFMISGFNAHRVTNPSECVFTLADFKSHIYDAYQTYDPIDIDVSKLSTTQIYHMAPLNGYSVSPYTHMNYLATTLSSQVDNGRNVDVTLGIVNAGMIYNIGDTVHLIDLAPIDFNGYKVLTGATTTTITFNQKSYLTVTDGVGTIWKKEWDYGNLTFPNDIKAVDGNVLIAFGGESITNTGLNIMSHSWVDCADAGTPYTDYDSTIIWFEWFNSLDDYKYWSDDVTRSNRVMGIKVFDGILTDGQKYSEMVKIKNQYTNIYDEPKYPQLEWIFDGYYAQKINQWKTHSRKYDFYGFATATSFFEFGGNLYYSEIIGRKNNWSIARNGLWESSMDEQQVYRLSTDNGNSWSSKANLYYAAEGVDTMPSTGGLIKEEIDSLLFQFIKPTFRMDSTSSQAKMNFFLVKFAKSDLTKYRTYNELMIDTNLVLSRAGMSVFYGDTTYINLVSGITIGRYFLKTKDGVTFTLKYLYDDNAAEGNYVNIGGIWYNFSRTENGAVDSPISTYITKSSNHGNTWSTVTPDTIIDRASLSAYPTVKKLSSGRTWLIQNSIYPLLTGNSRRDEIWFQYTDDGEHYSDPQCLFNFPSYINQFPFFYTSQRYTNGNNSMAYWYIHEDINGVVHLSCDNATNGMGTSYYFKMTKKGY